MSYSTAVPQGRSEANLIGITQNEVAEASHIVSRLESLLSRLQPPRPVAVEPSDRIGPPLTDLTSALRSLSALHSTAHKVLAEIEGLI